MVKKFNKDRGQWAEEKEKELVVCLEEPSFLGKVSYKVGTRPPKECCARGNHSFEDKL